jgi:hypothetical protein
VPQDRVGYRLKWLRYYLDFCEKYRQLAGDPDSLTREEVDAVVANARYPYDLVISLLYGCGLRRADSGHTFRGDPPRGLGSTIRHDGRMVEFQRPAPKSA